jgi:hypothetical protein
LPGLFGGSRKAWRGVRLDEVAEFKEHVADVIGRAIGPDRSVRQFVKDSPLDFSVVKKSMSGDSNMKLDTLSSILSHAGYRATLYLEPIIQRDLYHFWFQIPGIPHSNAAARLSRWAIIKEKKRWMEEVHYATLGKRPEKPLQRSRVTFTRHSSREPDSDNLRYSFKYIRDALTRKHCAIIEDDDPLHLDAVYCWEKARIKKSMISVEIQEMP